MDDEFDKIGRALRAVISNLDYDLHKALEYPEDEEYPEDDEVPSYDSMTTLFMETYYGLEK